MKLEKDFYLREDVVAISRELLGKRLVTKIDGKLTSGLITETEAYEGIIDKASHAYNNRRTARTEVMFGEGGKSYVYLCYGIHHLFNVVTNFRNIPHAVLVRAILPDKGIDTMLERRGIAPGSERARKVLAGKGNFTGGPGTVSQALGIKTVHSGLDLTGRVIWIENAGMHVPAKEILSGPRIGVDYAEDHAAWPYRFIWKKS